MTRVSTKLPLFPRVREKCTTALLILGDNDNNVFGTMMSAAAHLAMLARRPGLRTFVITLSTFPGAGAKVGKLARDNVKPILTATPITCMLGMGPCSLADGWR